MDFDRAAGDGEGPFWTFSGNDTVQGAELADKLNAMMLQYDLALDCLFTFVGAVLVFWMQGGFAMLEVGSVRAKNAQNILLKNLFDICVGAALWFAVGDAFAFGGTIGNLIGGSGFFGSGLAGTQGSYMNWFFGWTFAATAATIVSGALAERTKFEGYAFFSMAMTGFIYPVAVHWGWGDGFLGAWGFADFAGSGIVHALAGVAALTGAAIVGPRKNRFEPGFEDKFNAHNVPLVTLGTVILWMGWYGFNCGTQVAMKSATDATVVSRIAMVTTIAAAFGGLAAFLTRMVFGGVYDVSAMCNGILAGLVGITAVCDACGPWWSAFCGAGGGLVLIGASGLVQRLGIDDPLDAFAVHGAAGIWGTICVGLVHTDNGLFTGGGAGQLGVQLIGILVLVAWSAVLSGSVFLLLRTVGHLRVSEEVEEAGLDIAEHGMPAYGLALGKSTVWRGSTLASDGPASKSDKATEVVGEA